jgi:nitroreductase
VAVVARRQPIDTDAMKDSAWRTGGDGTPGPAMTACLEAALAAPSIHNSQPWLFRAHATAVDVLVDLRRHLPATDPDRREMYVSVGAAILNLRIAMLASGRQPLVRLLPDPDEPGLAATVNVGPAVAITPEVRELADAIPQRQTNRRPFGSTPIPARILEMLTAAARAEAASLVVVDRATRAAVLSLARSAEHQQRADPRYRTELAEWTTTGRHRGDGVPPAAFGPRPELTALPLRDFDLAHTTDRRVARFEADPTIAVLYTAGDSMRDWLGAGQALERVLLTATAHGIASTPMTQVIEVPQLRRLLDAPDELNTVQSIVRLGYAGRGPRTPRRPLAEVLTRPAAPRRHAG